MSDSLLMRIRERGYSAAEAAQIEGRTHYPINSNSLLYQLSYLVRLVTLDMTIFLQLSINITVSQ